MKRISEYKDYLGVEEGRKMKMQGALRPDVTVDVKEHFSRPNFKEEKIAEEKEEERLFQMKEAKTTVGAVKRLIQKVASCSINENILTRLDG